MNINLYDVYNQKLRKFARNDSVRMRGAFIEAVNNVFGELNGDVFEQKLMTPIDSFDDIMDSRLGGFVDITLDANSDGAISNREFFSFEWEVERMSATNTLTETITHDTGSITFTFINNIFTITGDSIYAWAELPTDLNAFKVRFDSDQEGNKLLVDGEEYALTYGVNILISGSTIPEIVDGKYSLAPVDGSATVFQKYQLVSGGLTYTLQYQKTTQNEWQLEITDSVTDSIVWNEPSEDGNTIPVFNDTNKTVQIGFVGDSPEVTNGGIGTSDYTEIIGVVSSNVIDGVSGWELTRLRFLTSDTLVYDFLLNEGTGTALTSVVADPTGTVTPSPYTATVDTPVWEFRYVEPSTNLSRAYISPFNSGIDFHLQESGEWAMESEDSRERRWYQRGIRQARSIYRINTPYQNPLGI